MQGDRFDRPVRRCPPAGGLIMAASKKLRFGTPHLRGRGSLPIRLLTSRFASPYLVASVEIPDQGDVALCRADTIDVRPSSGNLASLGTPVLQHQQIDVGDNMRSLAS